MNKVITSSNDTFKEPLIEGLLCTNRCSKFNLKRNLLNSLMFEWWFNNVGFNSLIVLFSIILFNIAISKYWNIWHYIHQNLINTSVLEKVDPPNWATQILTSIGSWNYAIPSRRFYVLSDHLRNLMDCGRLSLFCYMHASGLF